MEFNTIFWYTGAPFISKSTFKQIYLYSGSPFKQNAKWLVHGTLPMPNDNKPPANYVLTLSFKNLLIAWMDKALYGNYQWWYLAGISIERKHGRSVPLNLTNNQNINVIAGKTWPVNVRQ